MKKIKKRYILLIVFLVLLVSFLIFNHIWGGGFAKSVEPTAKTNSFNIRRDIAYFTGEGVNSARHKLNIYVPEKASGAPVVLIFHGGAWTQGSLELKPVQDAAVFFAERGIVAIPAGYRLVPKVRPPQQAQDVAQALAWVYRNIAQYGGDPNRIFLLGHSAGAHLSALVACDRTYLEQAGVPENLPTGVITLAAMFDLRFAAENKHPMTKKILRDAFGMDDNYRASLSPILKVKPGLPTSFLFFTAKGDHVVPTGQADRMAEALKAAGDKAQTKVVSGRGHIEVFQKMTHSGDVAGEEALAFIRSHN